jgi:hypothetical protein
MNTEVRKFQTLDLGKTYEVKSYDGPFKAKYGDFYILLISKEKSKETFEMYATPLLQRYIEETNPTAKFSFTVQEKGKNKMKCPFIEGYSVKRNWTVLE